MKGVIGIIDKNGRYVRDGDKVLYKGEPKTIEVENDVDLFNVETLNFTQDKNIEVVVCS